MTTPLKGRILNALPTPLLTVNQVAEQLQMSTRTVRRWIADGTLKAHRLGRAVRISEGDLQALLARCQEGKP